MKLIVGFAGLLSIATICMSATAPYELRGRKSFESVLDAHICQELFVQGRSLGWVSALQEVSTDLIVKQCVADIPSTSSRESANAVEGDVEKGWHVVVLRTGSMKRLDLPALGAFSNPSFCGRHAAYWANYPNGTWSVAIADLDSGAMITEVAVGKLGLKTDDVHFLPVAAWNKGCTEAVFERQGLVKKTSIVVKSNNSLQRR